MNRKYLENACEEIDASVFTGDVLFDDVDRMELRRYVERWLRAIDEHEKSFGADGKADSEPAQAVINCANAADASPAPAPAPNEEYVITDIDGRFYNAATGGWESRCATRYSFLTKLPCVIFGPPPKRETLTACMNDADEVVYSNSENRGVAWSEKWSEVAWKMVGHDKE